MMGRFCIGVFIFDKFCTIRYIKWVNFILINIVLKVGFGKEEVVWRRDFSKMVLDG